jgi:hypothetical protein
MADAGQLKSQEPLHSQPVDQHSQAMEAALVPFGLDSTDFDTDRLEIQYFTHETCLAAPRSPQFRVLCEIWCSKTGDHGLADLVIPVASTEVIRHLIRSRLGASWYITRWWVPKEEIPF